jgi:hypothetical protein
MPRCLSSLFLALFALTAWGQAGLADATMAMHLRENAKAPVQKLAVKAKRAAAQHKWAEAADLHAKLHGLAFVDVDYKSGIVVKKRGDQVVMMSAQLAGDLPWRHSAGIGWLYLLNLDKTRARQQFESVLKSLPEGLNERYLESRYWSVEGLVRIAEMEGRFADVDAIKASHTSEAVFICGTPGPANRYLHLPDELAIAIDGGARAEDLQRLLQACRKVWQDRRANEAELYTATSVGTRAGFLLGELYVRRQRLDLASKLFSEVTAKLRDDSVTVLQAQSYLRQMRAMKAR